MKVLLRRNVSKLGKIGEQVEVRDGYARNFLLPQRLAVVPTAGNLKAVEAEKAAYLAEMARRKSEFEARAAQIKDKEITIPARANEEGHLYGSVGPAQIVAALAAESIFVDEENVELDSPIRTVDKYDVVVRFSDEVSTTIHVWVVRIHEPGEEVSEGEKAPEGETPAPAEPVEAEGAPMAEAAPAEEPEGKAAETPEEKPAKRPARKARPPKEEPKEE